MYAHTVKATVFCKEGETPEQITQTLRSLFPFNLEIEKIDMHCCNATGFGETKIKIYEVVLKKQKHIEKFISALKEKLGNDQKEQLLRQAESRLDEELYFFIRFDKEKLNNKEYWITDSGNCFHLKLSVAAFPKNREKALSVIKEIFSP